MNWSQAFARQASSDLDACDLLTEAKLLPACHRLHYLQMACEKVCKAALIAGGADPLVVQDSHAYIAKQLPILVREYLSQEAGRLTRDNWISRAVRPLASKIERLNPAVRDGGRAPENSEYPWSASDGNIIAPADYKFDFRELYRREGIEMFRIVRAIAARLQLG